MSDFDGVILIPKRDPETGNLIIGHWQDVEALIERNKQRANEPKRQSDWGRHIASIGNGQLYKWWIEETGGNPRMSIYSQEFMREIVLKKLQDPQYAFLRVDGGPSFKCGWRPHK